MSTIGLCHANAGPIAAAAPRLDPTTLEELGLHRFVISELICFEDGFWRIATLERTRTASCPVCSVPRRVIYLGELYCRRTEPFAEVMSSGHVAPWMYRGRDPAKQRKDELDLEAAAGADAGDDVELEGAVVLLPILET